MNATTAPLLKPDRLMTSRPTVVRLMPVMDYGGVETIVAVLAERLPPEHFDFRVCTFWNDGEAAQRVRAAGIPCDVLNVDPRLKNPRATLALAQYLLKTRPALLHASISEANFHACLVARLFPRMKLVLEEVGTPQRSARIRKAFGLAYRRADALIGVSNATRRYLIENESAAPERTHLIYNCVDDQFFDSHPRRTTQDTFRVGAVGRLVREKNHETLLRAWSLFTETFGGDAELHVVGDGPLRPSLEELARSLGVSKSVVFHGYRKDVPEFLECLDLVVLTSTHEGYGIALVEAMAQRIPVIGSDAGGIPEVLKGYGDEWIVAARDIDAWASALLRMSSLSPAEREALGAHGRRLAEARFSSATYIRAIVALYDSQLL